MNASKIGALAGIAALLGLGASIVPSALLGRWVDAGAQAGSVPMLGTRGTSVAVYTSVVEMVGVLVTVGLGVGLGYWLARRMDDEDLRSALWAVAIGSGAALVIAATGPLVYGAWSVGGGGFSELSWLGLYLVVVFRHLVDVSLVLTVSTVAGAGFHRFDLGGWGGPRSTGTDRNRQSSAAADAARGDESRKEAQTP